MARATKSVCYDIGKLNSCTLGGINKPEILFEDQLEIEGGARTIDARMQMRWRPG